VQILEICDLHGGLFFELDPPQRGVACCLFLSFRCPTPQAQGWQALRSQDQPRSQKEQQGMGARHCSKTEKRGTACDAMGAANTPCDAQKSQGSQKKKHTHRQKIPKRGAKWPQKPGIPLISAASAATLAKAAETAARKPLPCAMLARCQHHAPPRQSAHNRVSPGPRGVGEGEEAPPGKAAHA
jgi:hypothetical protein